jgi:PIN domain nuclease of toxin-antitoxin system
LRTLGVRVEAVTETDAVTAATLWAVTRAAGLSLADRCCLALAARLGLTTLTADKAWAGFESDIPVQIIR